jgi:hypothetical protein
MFRVENAFDGARLVGVHRVRGQPLHVVKTESERLRHGVQLGIIVTPLISRLSVLTVTR